MELKVQKLDTLKGKDGKVYRVMDVEGDKLHIKEVKYTGNGFKCNPGRARTISAKDIEDGTYKKVDLPPVTVYKAEKREEVKAPAPHEKAAQIEAQAVSGYNKTDVEVVIAEAKDMKKTISKMRQDHEREIGRLKQEHEAEVQDLKDRIMELEILVKRKNEYADALDDDSVAFEEILVLAELVESAAKQAHNAAKLIGAKTEGRI